jgi:hypothetical protein
MNGIVIDQTYQAKIEDNAFYHFNMGVLTNGAGAITNYHLLITTNATNCIIGQNSYFSYTDGLKYPTQYVSDSGIGTFNSLKLVDTNLITTNWGLWTNSSPLYPVSFRKGTDGKVTIYGSLATTGPNIFTNKLCLFTLPYGFRPKVLVHYYAVPGFVFADNAWYSTNIVYLENDGSLYLHTVNSNTFAFALDGITFQVGDYP